MKYYFYSLIVIALLLAASVSIHASKKLKGEASCRTTNTETILHAWCWSFNTIRENMKSIADAGFTMVQTSPANQCFIGDGGGKQIMGNGKWYYHYQPLDWTIGNYQMGTRIIRKTKCFDFWERNVLFPKTKRSFFRTPKHPLPCPFPLNFSLLIITKKFGNLAKNRYICIV